MVRFTTKKIDSLTLGERMKKMRDDRRLTLSEVSKSTKIQTKYLEYLEENECGKLPADVYVRGFLRSYAVFMGVNEKVLIKQYEREKGIQKNMKKMGPENDGEKKISFSSFVITPGVVIAISVAIVVLGSIFYIYKEVNNFVSAPRLLILKPQDGSTVETNATHVSGVAEKDALVFINDQPVLVSEKGEFSEDVGLKEGVNNITVKARSKFQKEASQTVTVKVPVKAEAPIDPQQDSPANLDQMSTQNSVPITAEISVGKDPTWVSVEADGNLVYSGTFLAEAKQVFSANDNIKITSGKGNATFVMINGKDMGILGSDAGIVRDIEYNSQGKITK